MKRANLKAIFFENLWFHENSLAETSVAIYDNFGDYSVMYYRKQYYRIETVEEYPLYTIRYNLTNLWTTCETREFRIGILSNFTVLWTFCQQKYSLRRTIISMIPVECIAENDVVELKPLTLSNAYFTSLGIEWQKLIVQQHETREFRTGILRNFTVLWETVSRNICCDMYTIVEKYLIVYPLQREFQFYLLKKLCRIFESWHMFFRISAHGFILNIYFHEKNKI